MNRRDLLNSFAAIGTAGITGLAGCSTPSDLEKTTIKSQTHQSRSRSPTQTSTGSASQTLTPETQPPTIENYEISTTSRAGELSVTIAASDNEALGRAVIQSSVDELKQVLDGQRDAFETRITASPGEVEQIHLLLEDQAGNQTTERAESYVRKYDEMENARLNIGAVYIPFASDGLDRCIDDGVAEPSVGDYGNPAAIPAEITSKHIDQMQGHGIGRIIYEVPGVHNARQEERIRELEKSDLLNSIEIEPYYSAPAFRRTKDESLKEEVLPRDLSFIRENILERGNASTFEGRLVVSTWNLLVLTSEEELQEKVMDEFGDYRAFVEEMRTHLRKDGEEPFLVAGVGPGGTYLKHNEEVNNLVTQFDGIGTWFPGHLMEDGENTSPDAVYKEMKERYKFNENFANSNNLEFFPTAFPGYNEKENVCGDLDRRIPRSTELFRDMLHLSEKNGTTNRINIATWNGWVEGHQIEPGTFNGRDYGTGYLEEVKQFQQGEDG